jgi:hypothetical protein
MSEDFSWCDERTFYGRPQHETTDRRDPERLAVATDEAPCERATYVQCPHYCPARDEAVPPANAATAQTA